nr:AAA domain-containing protein [uncultured Halomonas sp.]
MIHLFVIAGISLTATGISWWNGQQTKAVRGKIKSLEHRLEEIYAVDYQERRKLLVSYVAELEALIKMELATRNVVATELTSSHAKARGILAKRLGSRESGAFYQVVLELELALSRINAERAHLELVSESLVGIVEGRQDMIPGPAELQLPNDFPREGGLVHFEENVPSSLHGYRLKVEDWSNEFNGRAMLYAVDHNKRMAKLSSTSAGLLESNLTDGGGAMLAKVVRRGREGIHLDYMGAALILPTRVAQDYSWLIPESFVEVYPHVWLLNQIAELNQKSPLPVRLTPRVDGSREFWSPILLSVPESKLTDLVTAYEKIDKTAQSSPWRVYLIGSSQVAFSLGHVTFVTTANAADKVFVLDRVSYEEKIPAISIRFHAGLAAFLPGSNDDVSADRSVFLPFVEALHAELSSQKQMLLQRQTALKLRKLSLIYQDQQEHIQTEGTCGFLPGEVGKRGKVIIGTITSINRPDWLNEAISSEGKVRIQVTGHSETWKVKQASWIDQQSGVLRLELAIHHQTDFQEINPFGLSRIERIGEGSQQQTLSKSLENAILGKFVSPRVHETLLGLTGDSIPNTNLSRASVEELLNSDEPVVSIWGPPGTGKTTLMVKWLTALFAQDSRQNWPSILVTAPTHVAVTKLVVDLLEKIPGLSNEVVRYGSSEKVKGTELEPVWHERLLSVLNPVQRDSGQLVDESLQRWQGLLTTREGREAAAKWLLGSKRIHAATCTGMARVDYGLWNRTFDIAIIDEAGKAFGAELLIPASVAKKVVLVGDHNQLPPTVTASVLDESIGYRLPMAEVEELLRRNMFHDIFEQLPAKGKGMLTTQYRMHKDIGDVVSEIFYQNCLKSARNEEGWNLTNHRLTFVDFSRVANYRHRQGGKSTSIENPTERAAVHALLKRMDKTRKFHGLSILVVCPYEAQRNAVEGEFERSNYDLDLDVTTVDAVQGGEANIVILMMTRSSGRVQFLLDKHRLNVALSRARDAVIIFGHVGCLTKSVDSPVSSLLKIGRRNKTLNLVGLGPRTDFKREMESIIT